MEKNTASNRFNCTWPGVLAVWCWQRQHSRERGHFTTCICSRWSKCWNHFMWQSI